MVQMIMMDMMRKMDQKIQVDILATQVTQNILYLSLRHYSKIVYFYRDFRRQLYLTVLRSDPCTYI